MSTKKITILDTQEYHFNVTEEVEEKVEEMITDNNWCGAMDLLKEEDPDWYDFGHDDYQIC